MIALGPREIGKAAALTLALSGLMMVADRVIAGFVQCRALGCLPW